MAASLAAPCSVSAADKTTITFWHAMGGTNGEVLQQIVDERLKDDNLKTSAVEVHLWKEATAGKYEAYKQDCHVVPTSYGGDTSGYQIPFTVNYTGERVKGKFDISSGTFTADSE